MHNPKRGAGASAPDPHHGPETGQEDEDHG